MTELLRGVGALVVAAMVMKACPDFAQALPIAVLAVVGWLRLFDICWGQDGKKDEEV